MTTKESDEPMIVKEIRFAKLVASELNEDTVVFGGKHGLGVWVDPRAFETVVLCPCAMCEARHDH